MLEIEEAPGGKKRYIVTFKQKEKRKESKDKTKILQDNVGERLEFIDIGIQSQGFIPPHDPTGSVAFDINDYKLPTIFTTLTEGEVGALEKDPNVEAVEPDGKMYALHTVQKEIPLEALPTQLPPEEGFAEDLIGGVTEGIVPEAPSALAETIPWGVSRIKAPMCWEGTKAKNIYVAVIDTGIWPHRDLFGNLVGGVSFVPGQSWQDGNGHGTHVAGTIAARINGQGIVGVSPSAYVFAIKVLSNQGWGQWSWLMAALYWMRKHHSCTFDVANLSLGGSSAPKALEAYINYASEKTLLVAAAGNNGKGVGFPAKYNRCLAVSAIQSNNVIAPFSSRGPEVELCAPGVNIYSTLPGNRFGFMSGTSMAAPHVSGAAALCRGTHRYLDMDHIRNILIRTADDLGNPGKDDHYGYGRVDANGSTFSKTCG